MGDVTTESGAREWEGWMNLTSKPAKKDKQGQIAMGATAGGMLFGPMGAAAGGFAGAQPYLLPSCWSLSRSSVGGCRRGCVERRILNFPIAIRNSVVR